MAVAMASRTVCMFSRSSICQSAYLSIILLVYLSTTCLPVSPLLIVVMVVASMDMSVTEENVRSHFGSSDVCLALRSKNLFKVGSKIS